MLAWLHTAPEQPDQKSETLAGKAAKVERKTRLQALQEDGKEAELPLIECGEHLVTWLRQIGPINRDSMGESVITESDLHYWQRNRGITLPPWQCDLLRYLSAVWLSQKQEATDPLCPPPWMAVIDRDTRGEVAKQLSSALRRRAKKEGSP